MDKIDFKKSKVYREDIDSVFDLKCDWNELHNKTILITGATGLIGSILVDMFIALNDKYNLDLNLILLARHVPENSIPNLKYISHDISQPIEIADRIDYIIHAASNTHPVAYATDPIGTITANVFGTSNLLNLISKNKGARFLLVSSVEIYGNIDTANSNGFTENEMGYLDCNTVRAGYCEAKRLSESLCQSYIKQNDVDCVIARLCRCYGPTLRKDDSKALSQFIKNGIEGSNIVLKSEGEQFFSYLYASDAACALIYLLLKGECGQAYNVSDSKSNIKLKNLAKLISDLCGTKVVFDLPTEVEKRGFSKANIAILDSKKINELGWNAKYNIESGIKRTFNILNGK